MEALKDAHAGKIQFLAEKKQFSKTIILPNIL
jgi:hypothetical protein